ncbi:MAG TPA: hypothetical protein VNF73_05340 [Candidatus Saccharimonadales bacterium]|nr:hypothetical protein [Candidatus Saccharimonadales bacterium]
MSATQKPTSGLSPRPTDRRPATTTAASSYYSLSLRDAGARTRLLAAMAADLPSADFLGREQFSLLDYGSAPQPLFGRLPISYRMVPLPVRSALLAMLFRRQQRRVGDTASPQWPIERALDDARRLHWSEVAPASSVTLSAPIYPDGRRAAVVLTHDIDSRDELDLIDAIRVLERRHDLASSFGFVPEVTWPQEGQVQRLVAEGCEVYCHDLRHDGKLPYMPADAIRSALEQVFQRSPWARSLMPGFRSGQLLMSPTLRTVVGELFDFDLSVPDTERGGPYGYAAGCGTVYPYELGSLMEIPLTLAQDIYVRHVYGLGPAAVLRTWLEKLRYIADVGGVAVLNTHPVWVNPKRPDMWQAYDAFLANVATDDRLWVTTPAWLVAWLRQRRVGTERTAEAVSDDGSPPGDEPGRAAHAAPAAVP